MVAAHHTMYFKKGTNMVSTTTWYANFNSVIRISLDAGNPPTPLPLPRENAPDAKFLGTCPNVTVSVLKYRSTEIEKLRTCFRATPNHHCLFALKYRCTERSKSYANVNEHKMQTQCKRIWGIRYSPHSTIAILPITANVVQIH